MSSPTIFVDGNSIKIFTESLSKTIDFSSQTVQLLLSLSTGVLAFSITFSKEIAPSAPNSVRRYLTMAWLLYFLSIPFGVVTMMAFTGLLTELDLIFLESLNSNISISRLEGLSVTSPQITIPAMLQFISFFLGVFCTFIYGFKSLKYVKTHD